MWNLHCVECVTRKVSVTHVISECSKLAQVEYKKRRDNVARIIYSLGIVWCAWVGQSKWYEHQPQSVSETDKTKVLWDFNIQCDHVIEARRPDIMVVGKEDSVCKIIRCCRTS